MALNTTSEGHHGLVLLDRLDRHGRDLDWNYETFIHRSVV